MQTEDQRSLWNEEAFTFDEQPDHGLRNPVVRKAWSNLLAELIPPAKTVLTALDVGCGTGSISLLLASMGYRVTGVDFSPMMIEIARRKSSDASQAIAFHVMDASNIELPNNDFDALLCRHLLWTIPEPQKVLERWSNLLKPTSHMILIEGFWHTNVGLHAPDVLGMLPASFMHRQVIPLSDRMELWGKAMDDERYAIVAHR
jgi:ubiquinone/menaquinone biosynthesis C-methylase UbiE